MRTYIAGPMTGRPDHNFPAFNSAAARWREAGHEVLNPAELEGTGPLNHVELAKVPAEWYYARDLRAMLDFGVEAIAVLPDWEYSTGANLEVSVGRFLRWDIYDALSDPRDPVAEPEPIVTLDDYQANARSTAGGLDRAILALGLAGEAGEHADLVKKELGHGHAPNDAKAAKELGDALWYVAMAATERGFTLGHIARLNARKLALRYPAGFSTAASIARIDMDPLSACHDCGQGDAECRCQPGEGAA